MYLLLNLPASSIYCRNACRIHSGISITSVSKCLLTAPSPAHVLSVLVKLIIRNPFGSKCCRLKVIEQNFDRNFTIRIKDIPIQSTPIDFQQPQTSIRRTSNPALLWSQMAQRSQTAGKVFRFASLGIPDERGPSTPKLIHTTNPSITFALHSIAMFVAWFARLVCCSVRSHYCCAFGGRKGPKQSKTKLTTYYSFSSSSRAARVPCQCPSVRPRRREVYSQQQSHQRQRACCGTDLFVTN